MPARKRSWFTFENVRRALVGAPIPTSKAHHERLSPLLGLPVFASDALSSVAYATEAILGILILGIPGMLGEQIWITLAICVLIVVISFSYQQTIRAYPTGGGSYIVASDNLGQLPGLLAGAALLIDYVLTVAVSVAAGVAALSSAYTSLHGSIVPISIAFIVLIGLANLRGVKESGGLFAVPTYSFVVLMMALIVWGLFKTIGAPHPVQQILADPGEAHKEANFAYMFLILRAFAAGCTALTGVEAVSDGVAAFKEPAAESAIKTLRWMTVILLALFLGLGYIAQFLPVVELYSNQNQHQAHKTLVAQIALWVSNGNASVFFYAVQLATAAILILAANTAFADFPRLSSFMARDGFLPRPFARQGDRLVFHNGIILLVLTASFLVWRFRGELDHLLPLYAVGVFTAFTLSQASMFRHWQKEKGPGWQTRAAISGVGAIITFGVLVIILVTKFIEGAWIVTVLLAILFLVFKSIKARYNSMARQLSLEGATVPPMPGGHTSLLLVPRVHRGILSALKYAKLVDPDCEAVHVAIDDRRVREIQDLWEQYGEGVPLVVLRSPYRSLIEPVLDYVDELLLENPDQLVTVIVPEAVSTKWYQKLLQENVAQQLKNALGLRENVVVTNVKYFLE